MNYEQLLFLMANVSYFIVLDKVSVTFAKLRG